MDELIERLKDEAGGYGDDPTVFTNDDIAALRSLLNEAAAALEAAREDAERYRFIAADHSAAWEEELDAAIDAAWRAG